jgi:hypothetical protein
VLKREQEGLEDLHLAEMAFWREGNRKRRRGVRQEDGCRSGQAEDV